MRNQLFSHFAPFAALLAAAMIPGSLQGQGRAQMTVTLTAVAPSVVRYIVDDAVRTPDGAPTVRVVTNDPAIRRSLANGFPASREPMTESSSMHSKGGEQVRATESDAKSVRYTIVTP